VAVRPSPLPGDGDLSLIRGDALFRLQRRIGLIPVEGLGVGRRALLLALVTWLPIAIWAVVSGRALGGVNEPLLWHYGVHVRCLVAIPLMVLAEATAHGVTARLLPSLLRSGTVPESERTRFLGVVHGVVRLRDGARPWIVIAGVIVAWTLLPPIAVDSHELVWAQEGGPLDLGFGGWWYLYVARPIFFALVLAWIWRLALLGLLLARVSRLDLSLVPTHPDRVGGLAFLQRLPTGFAPVVLGLSAVFSARVAHDVLHHGVHLSALRLPMIGFFVLVLVLFLAPLLVFTPRLLAAKREARPEYGALVGEHGRLVHRRWILREPVGEDSLLAAPEIGPVADTLALYEAVRKMRPVLIDLQSVLALAVPAALPMIAVLAIEIPIKDILLKILGTLV
jgi:hypothetical protein